MFLWWFPYAVSVLVFLRWWFGNKSAQNMERAFEAAEGGELQGHMSFYGPYVFIICIVACMEHLLSILTKNVE